MRQERAWALVPRASPRTKWWLSEVRAYGWWAGRFFFLDQLSTYAEHQLNEHSNFQPPVNYMHMLSINTSKFLRF